MFFYAPFNDFSEGFDLGFWTLGFNVWLPFMKRFSA